MPTRTLVCRRCGARAVEIAGRQPRTCISKRCRGEQAAWRVETAKALKLELNDRKLLQRLHIAQWDDEPEGTPV